jgi:hypothetical protein
VIGVIRPNGWLTVTRIESPSAQATSEARTVPAGEVQPWLIVRLVMPGDSWLTRQATLSGSAQVVVAVAHCGFVAAKRAPSLAAFVIET